MLDPDALFDVQIKRIHEYKRQILNILEAVALYDDDPRAADARFGSRGSRSSPARRRRAITGEADHQARQRCGEVVNADPTVRGLLKVVFLPNYNVSLAETIIPAADLSEQISTAGMEASGTGNMKFALNGALTIGTLDGANVEIREQVGDENIFIFGLTAEEVEAQPARKGIDGARAIAARSTLAEVLEAIASGVFSPDEPDRYAQLVDTLTYYDYFLVARLRRYFEGAAPRRARWRDQKAWWRSSILNTARMAWFSSDRTIREYAEEIWNVPVRPVPPYGRGSPRKRGRMRGLTVMRSSPTARGSHKWHV